MKLCSLTSGSAGNCIYVGEGSTNILLDVGMSCKRLEHSLEQIGLKVSDLSGILITHEHSDHIKGLGVVSRRYNIPIYATKGTMAHCLRSKSLGHIPEELFQVIQADEMLHMSDLDIMPFRISHDAAEPVSYTVTGNKHKCSIVTDLGEYNSYIIEKIRNSNLLFIEANHDVQMLQVGTYPYMLKQRILSKRGHLCNESAGQLISNVLHDQVKHIILGHLSRENNYPDLAFEAVRCEINLSDSDYHANDFNISVAFQDVMTEVFEV